MGKSWHQNARKEPRQSRSRVFVLDSYEGKDHSGANFRDSNLKGVNFSRALLRKTDFRGALLDGATFDGADLTAATFQKAKIRNSTFKSATLLQTNFDQADLTNSKLVNVYGPGASFWNADLSNSIMSFSNFEGSHFTKARLHGVKALQTLLRGVNFQSAEADGVDFGYSILEKADLGNTRFVRSHFDSASMAAASLQNASFLGCSFVNANCSASQAGGATFRHTSLVFSQFSDSDLRNAKLHDCKLYGSSFWNVNIENLKAKDLDISREGDGSLLTDAIQFAPLSFLLEQGKQFIELIYAVRLKSVLILGYDTGTGWDVLKNIQGTLRQYGLIGIIAKEQANIVSDSTIRKIQTLALLSNFVIVENTFASGHLYELPFVKNQDCVIAVLQESDKGATRMFDDLYAKTPHIKPFRYERDGIAYAVDEAVVWATETLKQFAAQHRSVNAWLSDPANRNLQ